MGRILAIDYGRKRCGIAVTDPARIIATPLTTVATARLWDFLKEYMEKEPVDCVVVGEPRQMDYTPSESERYIAPFLARFVKAYPAVPLERVDERFTSKIAFQSMIDMGLKKKRRQDKALVDEISAALILQTYM
ncbi:MAG: Holliday junction resolvase RuvX, partial [Bacteroidales bacterium]|nr:Holliday junction resolvase RuvX [Bacteroidales bacterium]